MVCNFQITLSQLIAKIETQDMSLGNRPSIQKEKTYGLSGNLFGTFVDPPLR